MEKEMNESQPEKRDETGDTDQKVKFPRSFLILGGGSILVMAGVVIYTIFFYLTLPNHHEFNNSEKSIRHVPLPAPPTTFLPSGTGKTVDSFDRPSFRVELENLSKTLTGFDASLTLTPKTNGQDNSGLSFAVVGTPRWVDANRNSGEGLASLSTGTVFWEGKSTSFKIHFSRMPTGPHFDLYIGLVGTRGVKGDRFLIHFSNLKTPGHPS